MNQKMKFLIVFLLFLFISVLMAKQNETKETNNEDISFVKTALDRIHESFINNEIMAALKMEKAELEKTYSLESEHMYPGEAKAKLSGQSIQAPDQAKEIEELYTSSKLWEKNPTREGLNELSDKIAKIGSDLDIKSMVKWKTIPNKGATIYYQTVRSREKGGKPESILNPSDSTQAVGIGRYYVWAGRKNKNTSDHNRIVKIVDPVLEVTIIEDISDSESKK